MQQKQGELNVSTDWRKELHNTQEKLNNVTDELEIVKLDNQIRRAENIAIKRAVNVFANLAFIIGVFSLWICLYWDDIASWHHLNYDKGFGWEQTVWLFISIGVALIGATFHRLIKHPDARK